MRSLSRFLSVSCCLFILITVSRPAPPSAWGAVCSEGVAEPPFLSYGVSPNLLLMIDNSASMLDMAYIGDDGYCYDDGYDNATSYAGYFDPAKWYSYGTGTTEFSEIAAATATAACNAATYRQTNYVCVQLGGTPTALQGFAATGNFLNWATASKIDIQKKILTGGKYHSANTWLVQEGRGCSGRRYVKKVALTKVSDGLTYQMTLGIRAPKTSEKTNASDDTTRIDLFSVTQNGFDNSACEAAIALLQEENPNQGQIKANIDDCMGYVPGGANSLETNSNAAFNHGIHNCWYYSKHDTWPPGAGAVSSMENACEGVYGNGVNPANLLPEDQAYPCYGVYNAGLAHADRTGYVGRCWVPATAPACVDLTCAAAGKSEGDVYKVGSTYYKCSGGTIHLCTSSAGSNKCVTWNAAAEQSCSGGTVAAHWESDACVEAALQDYCGIVKIPEVVDPSDAIDSTGEIWNIPAVLVDSGVIAQLDQPVAVLQGHIDKSSAPSGLVQEFSTDLRIGAMSFNSDGSATECTAADPHILYNCTNPANKDGASVISNIDKSVAHTTVLVNAINDIKANAWTPLAEAMYNAIGYYGQKADRRLNATDFTVDPSVDPVQYWCQDNHVLLITEGASTADRNASVKTFTTTYNDGDNTDLPVFDNTVPADGTNDSCNELSATTLLDDLTYFGQHASAADLYSTPQLEEHDKKNIKTHIVVAGTLRDTGATECSPDVLLPAAATNGGTTLYTAATDPSGLEESLRDVFAEIRAGASAGSAASVISSSRGGEGAVYQAIFWPELQPSTGSGDPVQWAGEVHSLFVDSNGYLYEDTPAAGQTEGDRTLTSSDQRVIIYFDDSAGMSKACYSVLNADGTCPAASAKNLSQVHYLWSASDWLAKISHSSASFLPYDANDVFYNRSTYISDDRRRYIFTWEDLDNDGIVDSAETLPFMDRDSGGVSTNWSGMAVAATRSSVPADFDLGSNIEVNKLVRWLRGYDDTTPPVTQRIRQIAYDVDHDGDNDTITWRLGDVIHSTPMVVAGPTEGYHLLYKDETFGAFAARYKKRRHMVYFGGNDGMMHAVNGGFFVEKQNKFCRVSTLDASGLCDESAMSAGDGAPELGAELWAYVPYNMLPHLKCLADPSYNHKYYVDQRPRIFDVRIFSEEVACGADRTAAACIHPYGWGTILVGAMRLGGAPVAANTLTGALAGDTRKFTSAYFILDITNPEAPPTLLGELTMRDTGAETDMGYTTAIPTMAIMTDDANTTHWYLVLGSGPHGANAMKGVSDQTARLAVVPLAELTSASPKALRIPTTAPDSNDPGVILLENSPNGFVSDLVTVDFDLNRYYKSDVIYFGTVEGSPANGAEVADGAGISAADYATAWNGKLYRMVLREMSGGTQQTTDPVDWVNDWTKDGGGHFESFIDVDQPITGTPSVGTDGDFYWVYFGTGRFFDSMDKADNSVQSFYGIKEPEDCDGNLTWAKVQKNFSMQVSGKLGLLQVDGINVKEGTSPISMLECSDGTENCLRPSGGGSNDFSTFSSLRTYIVGTGCSGTPATTPTGRDGWYRNFTLDRERNLGQATLLGGLLTFSTYQPYSSPCQSEGVANLFGIHYQTGTAWYETVFGDEGLDDDVVLPSITLGRGLATTPNLHVGSDNEAPKAFVQTSTGEIKEVQQTNMPIKNFKTGKSSWKDYTP